MEPGARRPSRRIGGRRLPAAAAFAVALALAAGCARVPAPGGHPSAPPAPAPPPAARPSPGYEALRDSLDQVDSSLLHGRRIVIDPGHGGHFAGSLGVGGLTEAAVNLDVALALRDLLVARGAIVTLTRETDRDFLTPADSSLHADLAERMRLANAAKSELFVSIHHNADARGAHDVNEIQTYYRLDDEGPSLDAARAVHRSLTRNLSIAAHRIIPGNYFVLRNSEAPAILTESSYLTNPDVEARLALPEKRRLEAGALFLGIAGFFARGAPEVVSFGKAIGGPGVPDDTFFTSEPWLAARVRGGFDEVDLRVDGARVPAEIAGDSILWRSRSPVARGGHVATLRVGLAGVGWSAARTFAFDIAAGGLDRIEVSFPDQPWWDARQPLGLRVTLLDAGGLPCRDSTSIRVREVDERLLAPADTVITARDGVAWAYFRRAATNARGRAFAVTLSAEPWPRIRVGEPDAPKPAHEPVRARIDYHPRGVPGRVPHPRTGFALAFPADAPLRDAPGTREPAPSLRWIDRDGFVVLGQDSAGRVAVPALAGYRAVAPDTLWPPRFSAIAGGALIGRRIALDPEGGGDDPAGTGPSGARASDLNLDVARALAAFLAAAGAEVTLVRDGDHARADLERVRAAEGCRAERYLRIAHRAAPPVIGHWFGSAAGQAWGRRVAAALDSLGLPAPPVAEEAQFVLQQASSTALDVAFARVDSAGDEERLRAPGVLRAEAYALFLALGREFAPRASFPIDSLEVRDADGRPVAGAAVRLGGALTLESGADGRVRFARTEPGPLEAAVVDERVRARAVLLDSRRGLVLTGPPAR